ncbi:MAG: PLP-dependent aminotransferase family protein, partial [Dehalococcoidia bacterium]
TGAKWAVPQGGCYTWLTMPEGTPMSELVDEAFDAGVGYLPGVSFAPNGDGQNCARLCFAYETPEKNRDGIARLAEFLDDKGYMKSAPGD